MYQNQFPPPWDAVYFPGGGNGRFHRVPIAFHYEASPPDHDDHDVYSDDHDHNVTIHPGGHHHFMTWSQPPYPDNHRPCSCHTPPTPRYPELPSIMSRKKVHS